MASDTKTQKVRLAEWERELRRTETGSTAPVHRPAPQSFESVSAPVVQRAWPESAAR